MAHLYQFDPTPQPTANTVSSGPRPAFILVLVILAFTLVYARSLALVYIEGDDAALVAYHAMGRIPGLQQIYSPYESLFDAALTLLPPREAVIRSAAMTLTAFSAASLFYLMMVLTFRWVPELQKTGRLLFVATMLFAIPEIYYLGMVITPSLLAMALLVGAHLLVRSSSHDPKKPLLTGFLGSALLFGAGAACRWDTAAYGVTIAADLLLVVGDRGSPLLARMRSRVWLCLSWGVLAGISWLVMLQLTGWNIAEVVHVVRVAGPVESLDWRLGIARAQTFFTPASALLIAVGSLILIRRKDPLAIVVIVSIAAVAKMVLYGVPKWFITMVPTMIACAAVGFAFVMQRRWQRWMLVGIVLVPWVVGVRFAYAGSAWGPGFELQPYNHVPLHTGWPSLSFGAGAATPTPEGPRPLFGHGWVLLGKWKPFVKEWATEQDAAVLTAIRANIPLLLPDDPYWPVDTYLSDGFTTTDSQERRVEQGSIVERRWTGTDGAQSRMVALLKPNQLYDARIVNRIRRIAGDRVVITGFSSSLIRLQEIAPDALEPLGKRTAFLRLDRLCRRLSAAEGND